MPTRPAQLWKELPLDKRVVAAEAFWADAEAADAPAQHVEAIVMLARRLNFRPKSMQALPAAKRAQHLARVSDVSDGIASRALIAYHFAAQRPLMSGFLDALGIAHDAGLITAEEVAPPTSEQLAKAVQAVRDTFPPADVELYMRTLSALDGETWREVDALLPLTP
jgi:hypothetical protein